MRRLSIVVGILFWLICTKSFSQWPIIRTDADSLLKLGIDYIYNIEFDKAEKCFKEVMQRYPDHPAGYFLNAMVDWWKIVLFRNTEEYDKIYLRKIDAVINVCNKILDTNSSDIKALFFKGGALGFRGRFYALRKDWLAAANDGKDALDILIQCLGIAPQNYDIMLGTGIYNYFAAAIPEHYPITKPLLTFLPKGDKQIGILQLKAASARARYSAVEAKVVLLNIYYDFENNVEEAQKIALELHQAYPRNPYFHRYLGRCYVRNYDLEKWEQTWREILLKFIDKQPGYEVYTAREALYYIGYALMLKGDYRMALKYFLKSNEASKVIDREPSGFFVKASLKIGNIYDILGQREEALKFYKQVLAVKEIDNSHKEANKYINNPYRR